MKRRKSLFGGIFGILFVLMNVLVSCQGVERTEQTDAQQRIQFNTNVSGGTDASEMKHSEKKEMEESKRNDVMIPQYTIEDRGFETGNMSIHYPMLQGVGDSDVEDKWNQIIERNILEVIEGWPSEDIYEINYEVVTQEQSFVSILVLTYYYAKGAVHPSSQAYTYNINLETGKSIRLSDMTDTRRLARNLWAGKGFKLLAIDKAEFQEYITSQFDVESLEASLQAYDMNDEGDFGVGYSYEKNGKIILCMTANHALGDYIDIRLEK